MLTVLAAAVPVTLGAFGVVERRTRRQWHGDSIVTWPSGSPYRAVPSSTPGSERAPLLVRAAALSVILLGTAVVPGATYAMATMKFDGIALSLLPAIASSAASWCAGWLLLGRARMAMDLCRLTVQASTASSAMLLFLALMHLVAARAGWTDRAAAAYVLLASVVALTTWLQATLLRVTVARHQSAFDHLGAATAHRRGPSRPRGGPE